jgi:hypothetical protein
MDEHCKFRNSGALDDVFGITRSDFSAEPWETTTSKRGGHYWVEIVPPLDGHQVIIRRNFESVRLISERLAYPVVESTLSAVKGKALADENGVPALVVNRFGKGLAVYLNCRLLYYSNHRVSTRDHIFAQQTLRVFRSLLTHAGILPAVELTSPIGVERVSFVDGPAEYVCLASNPAEEQGGLGEITGGMTDTNKPANVTVKCGNPAHVYDSRAGKYIGHQSATTVTIKHPEPLILARLPYSVDGLDLDAKSEYAKGGEVRAAIRLFSRTIRRGQKFVRHVFRCRLYGPDTLERTAARRNIATRTGRAVYSFDLALNEKPGTWKIVVRDIASGLQKTHEFKVAE